MSPATSSPALPGHRDDLVAAVDALPGPTVPPNASMLRSLLAVPSWRPAGPPQPTASGMPTRSKAVSSHCLIWA